MLIVLHENNVVWFLGLGKKFFWSQIHAPHAGRLRKPGKYPYSFHIQKIIERITLSTAEAEKMKCVRLPRFYTCEHALIYTSLTIKEIFCPICVKRINFVVLLPLLAMETP
jgi:hypothetical protein